MSFPSIPASNAKAAPFCGPDILMHICWRRVEKISWTDRVENEEALRRFKEERKIVRTIKERLTGLVIYCVGVAF